MHGVLCLAEKSPLCKIEIKFYHRLYEEAKMKPWVKRGVAFLAIDLIAAIVIAGWYFGP
jgi:hypothetical protein